MLVIVVISVALCLCVLFAFACFIVVLDVCGVVLIIWMV